MSYINRGISFVVCCLLFFQFVYGYAYGQKAASNKLNTTRLKTLNNKELKISTFKAPLLAIIFLSPECPICQNYSLTLNSLQLKFNKNVDLMGIFPGKGYENADYLAFQRKYNIKFMLTTDKDKALTKLVSATITPEVFLLDSGRNIIYHGAIDNWYVSLGKNRKVPTINYLENAMVNYLSGTKIEPAFVKAIGCYIMNE